MFILNLNICYPKPRTTWSKATNHADFHVRSNWIFVDSTCFLMHSGQKTTKPRDISHLFYKHILAAKNTSLHRNRRPLARSPFFLGNSLHFVSLVLFSPPSFRRHRIVAQPRQWMRLHMLRLCGVD